MRLFNLSSTKFQGSIELVYNDYNQLQSFDAASAVLNDSQIYYLLRIVPPALEGLQELTDKSKSITIVESALEVDFEQFWKPYLHKRNRFKAEEVWNRMSKADQVKAVFSLPGLADYKKRNPWYSIMLADRYLKEKHYVTDWKTLKS